MDVTIYSILNDLTPSKSAKADISIWEAFSSLTYKLSVCLDKRNFSAKDIDGSLVKRPMIKDQFVEKWRRLRF